MSGNKFRTSKWEVITPSIIGDFKSKESEPYYGIIIPEHIAGHSTKYKFGRWNKDRKEDGINGIVWGLGLSFGEYRNGKLISPRVDIGFRGSITIYWPEEHGHRKVFYLDNKDSSFRFSRCDDEGDEEGVMLKYDGLTNTIEFAEMSRGETVKKVTVPKRFGLRNPIIHDKVLLFPEEIDNDQWNFFDTEGQSYVHNALPDKQGIGVMTVNEDLYVIGRFFGNERYGYQAGRLGDACWEVIYGHGNEYDGPTIEVRDDGSVWIMTKYKDDKGNVINSAIIKIKGDTLELVDATTGAVEVGDPEFRFANFNELSFDDKGDLTFTDYYYADKMFDEWDKENEARRQRELAIQKNDPEYKMMSLVGQEDAKKEFTRIRAYIQKNDASKVYKNIVFSGENGVGKSTVGKLIAEILYKYKAIDYNRYTESNGKELYDQFTGGTKGNLTNLMKEGEGGVILIDDIHYIDALNSSNINEGLFSLAKIMEDHPETVFILCDNKYNMNQIMENNKDLFQRMIRFHVDFKDFTRDELKQILDIKLEEKGYSIEPDAMKKLLDIIFLAKSYGNNINASAAISILEEVIVIQNVRTELSDSKVITIDDIDVYVVENDIAFIDEKTGYQSDARKKLDELIGLEKIKDTVDDLIAYFSINRGKKVDFHMCFSGNPGTGKTEVARIMGKLLRQEGILPTSKFLEVTRKDLVGQYIGQTAILTRDLIDKAMGGVLYIDEAYSLAYGTDNDGGGRDFGREAIAELLKAMEDRRGEFCVILAGYTSEMKKLFDLNPGFKSRIKFDLEFPDYSEEELEKIARLFLKRDNVTMSDENIKFLVKIVSIQRKKPNFANVRTLREAISRVQIKHARKMRLNPDGENMNELDRDDILATFSEAEVQEVYNDLKEEVKVPKLNPQFLRDLYQESKPEPFEDVKDYLAEAVLALKMSEGKNGEGTGFLVSKDGYFLTCAHCVDGANKIEARRRISHHGRHIDINYNAIVVSLDKKIDVALCKLESEGEEFDYLRLSTDERQLDKLSKVYLLGYPFGVSRFDEMSINEGKVASYQKPNQYALGQINLDIQAKGGNSGSPLIDAETSEVIGVFCGSALSFGAQITEEINYARPIEYVWNMLDKDYKENN